MSFENHEISKLTFEDRCILCAEFTDGAIRKYDVTALFNRYPVFTKLLDKELFESGKADRYGVIWNDDIDLDSNEIYNNGY